MMKPKRQGHQILLEYPVHPRPRWGHGLPPHPPLQAVLERGRADYEKALSSISDHRAVLHTVSHEPAHQRPTAPHWNNIWFSVLDAASLMGFLLSRRPKRYMEIGSGNSTKFARHSTQAGQLPTTITSVDPQPRAEIDAICDRVIRKPLEECDVAIFDELDAGDILSFDGSHRVFTNSDVTVFFFEVLPRLKPGILVHIHDIFLPADYTPAWNKRFYSEQYLLGAMLLCGAPPFRVILPNYFVCTDEALSERVLRIFQAEAGGRDIPFRYPNRAALPGVSFWLQTTPQS